MNAKFKQAVVYSGVIMLVFSAPVAYAQPSGDVPQRVIKYREEVMNDLIKELDLTPEQQEQIKRQQSEHRQKNEELRGRLLAKRLELKQELEKQTINKKRIDTIAAEIKILVGEQLEQRVEGVLSMKEILTPEQFKKFQQKVRSSIRDRRGSRKEGRGRGGRPF